MGSRLVIEQPTMTYREAKLAAAAEEQQYGGSQKTPKAPTDSGPRMDLHEREAHLVHSASARELRASAGDAGPRVERRTPELDYARAVSLRESGMRTEEERRLMAGLATGDASFIDEVARGISEAAVDIPSLVGLPTVVGKEVIDAIKKFGQGGGRGGRGGMLGDLGGPGGSGVDTSMGGYAPKTHFGRPGEMYGGRERYGGTPGGSGGGGGNQYGLPPGFSGGRGDAMDPKSPTGGSLGGGASSTGGNPRVPGWNPRGAPVDMSGEGYGRGSAGFAGTRPDALYRARTWKAFNPGGGVMDDKPKDGGATGGDGGTTTTPSQPTTTPTPSTPATPDRLRPESC